MVCRELWSLGGYGGCAALLGGCPSPRRGGGGGGVALRVTFSSVMDNISPIEMGRQREFQFRTWGGRRAGSGRKPRGKTAGVAHAPRPVFARTLPVHVTFRIRKGVWNLRRKAYRTVERALGDG